MNPIPRQFALALPPGLKLLNANQRVHHRVRSEATNRIRSAAMMACSEDPTMRAALVLAGDQPLLRHAYILGVLHPPSRRRADPGGPQPRQPAVGERVPAAAVGSGPVTTEVDHRGVQRLQRR